MIEEECWVRGLFQQSKKGALSLDDIDDDRMGSVLSSPVEKHAILFCKAIYNSLHHSTILGGKVIYYIYEHLDDIDMGRISVMEVIIAILYQYMIKKEKGMEWMKGDGIVMLERILLRIGEERVKIEWYTYVLDYFIAHDTMEEMILKVDDVIRMEIRGYCFAYHKEAFIEGSLQSMMDELMGDELVIYTSQQSPYVEIVSQLSREALLPYYLPLYQYLEKVLLSLPKDMNQWMSHSISSINLNVMMEILGNLIHYYPSLQDLVGDKLLYHILHWTAIHPSYPILKEYIVMVIKYALEGHEGNQSKIQALELSNSARST